MRQHLRAAAGAFAAVLLVSACGPRETAAPEPARAQALVDLETLSSDAMEGRYVGSEGSARARAYLLERFEATGLQPVGEDFEHAFPVERPIDFRDPDADRETLTGVNLIGRFPGRSGETGGPVMIITAHYDHLGVRDGEIFNGADDNASGVAAMLAVADMFSETPPAHEVIFAALDAEEGGLNGARALVADSPVPLDRVALNLNLDMVAQNEAGEIYVAGLHHFPWLSPHIDRVEAQAPATVLRGHDSPEWGDQDWTRQSDHFAFFSAGIPFLYFGVEDHEHYHRPSDTFETIPQDRFLDFVRTVQIAARELDGSLSDIAAQHRDALSEPQPSAAE
jgi:Zn-dependent M28 family amino/carboxypeptidase